MNLGYLLWWLLVLYIVTFSALEWSLVRDVTALEGPRYFDLPQRGLRGIFPGIKGQKILADLNLPRPAYPAGVRRKLRTARFMQKSYVPVVFAVMAIMILLPQISAQ